MRQILPLIFLTLISCTTSNRQTEVTADSKEIDFDVFVKLFENRLTKVPDKYVRQFLQVDSVEIEVSKIWTYETVRLSDEIIGLVYKATCTAGGLCDKFILVTFDRLGNKVGETEVGHKYADYGSSSELTYSFDKERIELKLKETEVLEAEDGTDKEQMTVDTTYHKRVDPKSGKISGD